jgi:hypothetical protein
MVDSVYANGARTGEQLLPDRMAVGVNQSVSWGGTNNFVIYFHTKTRFKEVKIVYQ